MAVFEAVVVQLLERTLADQLTDDMRAAWRWLWTWLTESMYVVEQVRRPGVWREEAGGEVTRRGVCEDGIRLGWPRGS